MSTTINPSLSIFFPLLTNVTSSDPNTFCCNGIYCKEGNVNQIDAFSIEFVFEYTISNTLNENGAYMTLFHFGTTYVKPGLCLCLKDLTGNTQIGVRQYDGSQWIEIPNSFTPLTFVTQTLTSTYMILFSFSLKSQPNTFSYILIPFISTEYNSSSSQLITVSASHTQNFGATESWCIGSVTQVLSTPPGYVTTNSYNSYPSQNIQMSFIRTWQRSVDIGSSTVSTTIYSIFNQNSQYSLYLLNRGSTFIQGAGLGAPNSIRLESQLGINNNSNTYTLWNTVPSTTTPVSTSGSVIYDTYNSTSLNAVNNYTFNNWKINYNNSTFTTGSTTYSVVSQQTSTLACLLKGTKILTPMGYTAIENLKVGQKILTHKFKVKEILEIHESIVYPITDYLPYIVPKGKLNAFKDLFLSPYHGVLIGKKFHYAKDLGLDRYKTNELLHYFHIKTEDYFTDTLVANGVVVETYNGKNLDEEYYENYKLLMNKFNERLLLL